MICSGRDKIETPEQVCLKFDWYTYFLIKPKPNLLDSKWFDSSLSKLKRLQKGLILMGLLWLAGMTQTQTLAFLLKTSGELFLDDNLFLAASIIYLNFCLCRAQILYLYIVIVIRSNNLKTRVIGCPKTIDGDLKCKEVPTSFGFDTACKVIKYDYDFNTALQPFVYRNSTFFCNAIIWILM